MGQTEATQGFEYVLARVCIIFRFQIDGLLFMKNANQSSFRFIYALEPLCLTVCDHTIVISLEL